MGERFSAWSHAACFSLDSYSSSCRRQYTGVVSVRRAHALVDAGLSCRLMTVGHMLCADDPTGRRPVSRCGAGST
jgi:hypothetical protein